MVNIVYKKTKYFKFILLPDSNVLIDVLHNVYPKSELFVEEVLDRISGLNLCSTLKCNYSRIDFDFNREVSEKNFEGVIEYRELISRIYNPRIPFLHISIHGMKDRENKDIEIGTRKGKLAKKEICDWFINKTKKFFKEFNVVVDEEFKGNKILEQHRFGEDITKHQGFGENYNVFQIEFSKSLRENRREEIILFLKEVIKEFKINY